MNNKSILITGVSTGIGLALAKIFLQNDFLVFGSIRKQEDAAPLQKEFPALFTPLVFDVTDQAAISNAVKTVEDKLNGKGLGGLINNAGIAEGGPLQLMPMDTIRRHFEINVLGVIAVTRAFLPMLGTRKNHASAPGKIINIGSTSGKIAGPFVAPYAGSKHALEGISHSWGRELKKYGIDIIIVGPGAIKTPIWDKGIHFDQYKGSDYEPDLEKMAAFVKQRIPAGYTSEYLAMKVWKIFNTRHPKARYAIVPRRFMRWTLPTLMPHRWLDKVIGTKQN